MISVLLLLICSVSPPISFLSITTTSTRDPAWTLRGPTGQNVRGVKLNLHLFSSPEVLIFCGWCRIQPLLLYMTLQDFANAWIGSAKVGTSELLEGTEISFAATSNDTLSFSGPGSPRSILTGSQQFAPSSDNLHLDNYHLGALVEWTESERQTRASHLPVT